LRSLMGAIIVLSKRARFVEYHWWW